MIRLKVLLNILAYLACLLATAPLYPYLDRPVQAFLPLALLAGMFCDRRESYPLRPWQANILSIILFVAYALQISHSHLVAPVVHILVLLLALRLVTAKAGRHYLQIFVLAVFALAGSTLLTLSASFLVYLLLLIPCVTVGLVLLTFHAADQRLVLDRREFRRIIAVALLLPAFSLPLMLAFFVILPRTRQPLWNFLNPPAGAAIAFSDSVQPGAFAGLAETGAPAFRVEMEELAAGDLYWRGTVLNTLEGSAWVRQPPPGRELLRVAGGRPIRQTVYPEAAAGSYLFALDPPLSLRGVWSREAADLVHTTRRAADRRFRYEAISHLGGSLLAVGQADRSFYLQVAGTPGPRTEAAARRIAGAGGSDREKIARLERFFLDQGLTYATTGLPGSEAPVEEFLFEKKRGYCEFFASSFAVLLRLSGVPARLVGGYHGGEYNRLGGYYLVREDAAHVWVEALVDGREWVRIDPSGLARNPVPPRRGPGRGRELLDALDYWWTRAVITYDLGNQIELLEAAQFQLRDARWRLPGLRGWPWLAAAAALAVALAVFRRRRSPEEVILRQYLRRVEKVHRLGRLGPADGLLDLAARTRDPLCREFAEIYGRAVFRDRALTAAERRRLRQLIRRLHP